MWIDTHCHLDAADWSDAERCTERVQARDVGVDCCVLPSVQRSNWGAVRHWAAAWGDAYALGLHPLYLAQASEADLLALDAALHEFKDDPHLVAVGEIGLDFGPSTCNTPQQQERQRYFYRAQLRLAQRHGLPVLLHVRRSADALLQGLRAVAQGGQAVQGGIVHAFNGSLQQAQAFMQAGFALGLGGAVTFEGAHHLRRLASHLPLAACVLETDAPDMPPQWLYATAAQRAQGQPQGRNGPSQLPRIAAHVAALRAMPDTDLAQATRANALRVLPRLNACLHP